MVALCLWIHRSDWGNLRSVSSGPISPSLAFGPLHDGKVSTRDQSSMVTANAGQRIEAVCLSNTSLLAKVDRDEGSWDPGWLLLFPAVNLE